MQAADGVDVAAVFTADEDFEFGIDGTCIFDEATDHFLDGGMNADERVSFEEFFLDVEGEEAVGVVAGDGECRLCEVVCTKGCESVGGVAIVVVAGFFTREFGDDFAGGDGGSGSFDHGTQSVRDGEALFFFDLRGDFDGDFSDRGDFGCDDDEWDFDFGLGMFAFFDEFGGGIQDGLNLHFGNFGVRNGHTDRTVTEHRVFFLFEPAVVGEEFVERGVEQADRHAVTIHDFHGVFEVGFGEFVDLLEGFFSFCLVVTEEDGLDVGQAVAQEHVFGAEETDATRALVVGGKCFGGFGVGANVEGFDFLAPIEDGLSRFFELGGNGHGDFAQVDFARRAADGDVIAAFDGVAVAGEGAGGFVDGDFGGADDGGDTPSGCHDGGVGNFGARRGENTAGGFHALDVFLARHDGDEDGVFFVCFGGQCFVLCEANFTAGGAR